MNELSREALARRTRALAPAGWISGLLLGSACIAAAHAAIFVENDAPPTALTCTLAQAINAANTAAGIDPATYGSSTPAGDCPGGVAGSNTIVINVPTVTLTTIDNYWYGPNALPPIASTMIIAGVFHIPTIRAVHAGDPAPTTANAFRFFYVSGGLELPPGSLTLFNVVLQGGYAKGGDSGTGGGGAGMGGAIFNQGTLSLQNVSLIGNAAHAGAIDSSGNSGGGGIGEDGGAGMYSTPVSGGGFGHLYFYVNANGGYGSGGSAVGGGGGGGGFISGSNGSTASQIGGAGGGSGQLGGAGGLDFNVASGAGGDGGGGGGSTANNAGSDAGRFGLGGEEGDVTPGVGGGGGGGVGGGGSSGGLAGGAGGGGGFGGGGGAGGGDGGGSGGFGAGGGGGGNGSSLGGFGGGFSASANATGGAGMGGAIFNHTGTVYLLNVTATGNGAIGGAGDPSCSVPCSGSGMGAVLFNLNGSVTVDFSTLAGNFLSGNNAGADSAGPQHGTIYSLAYGNKIQDGSASSAVLTIHNSIVRGTQADAGLRSDVSMNVVNGAHINSSSLVFSGKNFVHQSYSATGVAVSGILPDGADPLLGPLSLYVGPPGQNTNPTPVLPIGPNSPAYNTAPDCHEADGLTTLTSDERFTVRPKFSQCDVGAYEFDGDYIFADGVEVKL